MGSNRWLRNSFVYLLVIIGVLVIFYTLLPSFGNRNEIPLTTVVKMAENNEVREIIVDGRKLTVIPRLTSRTGPDRFSSRVGENGDVLELLSHLPEWKSPSRVPPASAASSAFF